MGMTERPALGWGAQQHCGVQAKCQQQRQRQPLGLFHSVGSAVHPAPALVTIARCRSMAAISRRDIQPELGSSSRAQVGLVTLISVR